MFTELYQLIQKANLKNISLTLQDEGNGKMAVTVMTQNNVGDAADPKLRQALTQPLKVAASPMLLDEEFIKHLNSFSESYVEATVTANTGNVTETMSNATPKQADPVAAATARPSEQDIEQPEQATNLNDIDCGGLIMSASLLQSTPLKRVFKLGALEVECNSPNATFEESIKAIRKNYPFFRFGKIYEDDGLVDGERMVYTLPKLLPTLMDNGTDKVATAFKSWRSQFASMEDEYKAERKKAKVVGKKQCSLNYYQLKQIPKKKHKQKSAFQPCLM